MANWKRGLLWIAAGVLVAAVALAFTILGGGEGQGEPKGAKLALLVVAFYAVFTFGASAMVRGVLLFMAHLGRQAALMVALVTFGVIVLSVVLHNVIYAITGSEEAFFFLIALWVGPVTLLAAIIRFFRPAHDEDLPPAAPLALSHR